MNDLIKAKKILLTIVISWFIIRVISLFFISQFKLFEVHDIAVNMVKTGEMKYFLNGQMNYNYQFPVYPFLLFIIYKIFGIVPELGEVLNCIFHSLTAVFGFCIFNWFSENCKIKTIRKNTATISLLASIGILFHPLINYYTLLIIHPFSLDLLLITLSVFYMINYFKNPGRKNILIFGIVFGITLLNRITFIVLILPFFIFIILNDSVNEGIKRSIIVLLIGFLFLVPWLYRNYTIYQKLSINSSLGQNLWLGIQDKTGGSAYLPDGNNYYQLIPLEEWNIISKLNSVEQSDYFFEKYKQTAISNPMFLLKMYFVKLKNFWFFREGIGTEYNDQIKKWIPFYKYGYIIVLLFSIYFVIKVKKDALIISSIPVALSLVHAIFYVETRHRIIIEPILIFMTISSVFILTSVFFEKKNV